MTAHDPEVTGAHWETAPDGTRVFIGEDPPRKKRGRRKPPNHMPAGSWRYDTDESGRKFKRALTDAEVAEKERFAEEKAQRDAEHRQLIHALIPIVATGDDPPGQPERLYPAPVGKYPGKTLVELERPNGSTFVMTFRMWTGEDKGIEPFSYCNAYVRFSKQGLRFRTRGVMFASVAEMRAAAEALTESADRIEAEGLPMAEREHPLVRFPMPETPSAGAVTTPPANPLPTEFG